MTVLAIVLAVLQFSLEILREVCVLPLRIVFSLQLLPFL